jgi:chaperonin GroES
MENQKNGNSSALRPRHRQAPRAERTTASGIVIPDSAGEKPDQGEVLAVGNGRLLASGDCVRWPSSRRPRAVRQVRRPGRQDRRQDALVLREEDVIAIIER